MQLFVYSDFSEAECLSLQRQLPADVAVTFRAALPPEQQLAEFARAELLLGNAPRAWLADHQPPQLKFWQIESAGFHQYAGLALPFPVANMGDFYAWPCAETMVGGLLAHYRHLPELAVLQSRQQWADESYRAGLGLLGGKRVVVLGAGTIGRAVRQQLLGFNCQVQLLARTDPAAQLHSKEELAAVLPETDIVVNCLPGSAKGFFSAVLIGQMKAGSVYASVGRGTTTDEPALIAALQAGRLSGAVLDVTTQEPLPTDSPLWTLPRVLLTQHTGGGQPHETEGKIALFLRNFSHLREGEELENRVELRRGY